MAPGKNPPPSEPLPVYDSRWATAPAWVQRAVYDNWPQDSGFKVLGVKERLGDYAVAIETKEPDAEGNHHWMAKVITWSSIHRHPKQLMEMFARDATLSLGCLDDARAREES